MSRPSGHPEIGSIIKKRDIIHFCLYPETPENYKPKTALWGILGLIREVEDKHRDKDLIKSVKHEIGIINKMQDISQRDKRYEAMRFKYGEWLEKLNDILWKGKYLDPGRYGPDRKKSKIKFGEKNGEEE